MRFVTRGKKDFFLLFIFSKIGQFFSHFNENVGPDGFLIIKTGSSNWSVFVKDSIADFVAVAVIARWGLSGNIIVSSSSCWKDFLKSVPLKFVVEI